MDIIVSSVPAPDLPHLARFGLAFVGMAALFAGGWMLRFLIEDVREVGFSWDGAQVHALLTFPALAFWFAVFVSCIGMVLA